MLGSVRSLFGGRRRRPGRPRALPRARVPAAPLLRRDQRRRGPVLAVAAAGRPADGSAVDAVRDLRARLPGLLVGRHRRRPCASCRARSTLLDGAPDAVPRPGADLSWPACSTTSTAGAEAVEYVAAGDRRGRAVRHRPAGGGGDGDGQRAGRARSTPRGRATPTTRSSCAGAAGRRAAGRSPLPTAAMVCWQVGALDDARALRRRGPPLLGDGRRIARVVLLSVAAGVALADGDLDAAVEFGRDRRPRGQRARRRTGSAADPVGSGAGAARAGRHRRPRPTGPVAAVTAAADLAYPTQLDHLPRDRRARRRCRRRRRPG